MNTPSGSRRPPVDQLELDLGVGVGVGVEAAPDGHGPAPRSQGAPGHLAPRAPSSRLGAVDLARLLGRPDPTPEQVRVVEAPPGPLLVVAGAGSGKTETMAARVVWLVANGMVQPDQVLGLTFTRKAAGELAARLRRRLDALRRLDMLPTGGVESGDGEGGLGEASVSTYHSFAGAMVRDHGLRLGVEPGSRLLGEAAAWQLASEVVLAWDGDMTDVAFAFSTVVDAVLSLAGECAEHLVDVRDVGGFLDDLLDHLGGLPQGPGARSGVPAPVREVATRMRARRALVPLVAAYVARKREREVLDFGDQVALAARIATQLPTVRALERTRSRVVLLDEYQDTSHAQVELLRALFAHGHPVTAVGDPHQSIYGWRGASAGTLEAFGSRFPSAPGAAAATVALSTTWRNDTAVLDVANRVAAPLRDAALAVRVAPLRARPGAPAGTVRAAYLATTQAEAAWVAGQVAAALVSRTAAGPRPSVAVLCRKRAQIPLLEGALRAAGLPVEVVGLGGLLVEPEVADVVAALQVAADPMRGDALVRLLTGPRWRVGPRDLVALAAWSRRRAPRPAQDVPSDETDEASLVDTLDALEPGSTVGLSPTGQQRLLAARDVMRRIRAAVPLPLPDLVTEAESALLLDVEVGARGATGARAHLDAFADAAVSFAADADPATGRDAGRDPATGAASLAAFLAWLEAAQEQERGLEPGQVEVNPDAVQLLTVHAAKGLEWDVVAVPGLCEGGLPAKNSPEAADSDRGWLGGLGVLPHPLRGDREALPPWRWQQATDTTELVAEIERYRTAYGEHRVGEERRLAYVALTRARSVLLLSGAWWGETGKTRREPSRFLREVSDGAGAPVTLDPYEEPGESNPALDVPRTAAWPFDPLGRVRADVEAGAALVTSAVKAVLAGVTSSGAGGDDPEGWARQVDLLLAERAAVVGRAHHVVLPTHLSASRLVQLAEDPEALALAMVRPMPQRPSPQARLGTAFHAWLERRFSAEPLVDVDELPGSADEHPAGDDRLLELQERFLASEWADADLVAVEVAVETPVHEGATIRGRIDAVVRHRDPQAPEDRALDRFEVVDWKTGEPPTGAAARARAVQLAAYRLAWSRLTGTPLDRVGGAFFYASTGQTVRPELIGEAELSRLLGEPGDA